MSTAVVIAIVVGAVVLFVAIFAIALRAVARAAKEHEAAARREFPNAALVDSGALFFGQESRGAAQLRGNGTLVLTDAEMVFKQWVVDREFRVPLGWIVAIEKPRSFLGKSQFVELLCVKYRDDAGKDDAMAWRVRDLSGWIQAIERARSGAGDASREAYR